MKVKDYMCKFDLNDASFSISVGRSLLRVSFPMFWFEAGFQYLCKSSENSSGYSETYKYQNHYLLRQHAVNEPENRGSAGGLRHIDFFLQQLGFVKNLKKSILFPTQNLEFLGLEIDSVQMTLILPEAKVKKLMSKCKILFANPKATLLEVTRLICTLCLTTQVVLPALLPMKYL